MKPFETKGKEKSKKIELDFIFLPPKSQIALYFKDKNRRIKEANQFSYNKDLKNNLHLTHHINLHEEASKTHNI